MTAAAAREAGPPNHHDDKVDSGQEVVNTAVAARARKSAPFPFPHEAGPPNHHDDEVDSDLQDAREEERVVAVPPRGVHGGVGQTLNPKFQTLNTGPYRLTLSRSLWSSTFYSVVLLFCSPSIH